MKTQPEQLPPTEVNDGFSLSEVVQTAKALLSGGWRPTRWRHPFWGDLELVVSDGCWIARDLDGHVFHHFRSDRFAAAIEAGRTVFARDAHGNLILVAPPIEGKCHGKV